MAVTLGYRTGLLLVTALAVFWGAICSSPSAFGYYPRLVAATARRVPADVRAAVRTLSEAQEQWARLEPSINEHTAKTPQSHRDVVMARAAGLRFVQRRMATVLSLLNTAEVRTRLVDGEPRARQAELLIQALDDWPSARQSSAPAARAHDPWPC